MRLSEEDLARLAELEAKASKGPWRGDAHGRACDCLGKVFGPDPSDDQDEIAYFPEQGLIPRAEPHNINLVAESRNALAALIAEVRAGRILAKAVEDVRDYCDANGREPCDGVITGLHLALRAYRGEE